MRWHTVPVAAAIAALACPALAQGDPCQSDSGQLNSGFQHTGSGGGAVYPIGAQDAWYRILHDPDPGTTEPRPAGVILKHPAWANPDPNSQWLGAYPGSSASINGFYVFEVCFCLREGFQNVVLNVGAKADDAVSVYLNETLNDVITNTATPILPLGDGYTSPTINTIQFTDQSRFRVGRNCLMFRVENLGAVAMGLDTLVSVTAPGGFLEDPSCCSNGSIISGQKWNDLNADGIRDAGEPILANWPITLTPGGAINTDTNGYYYFMGLTPGAYTVTEGSQPGWVQTFPASGQHNVNLGLNEIKDHLDFGNTFRPCGEFVDQSIVCVPDDTGWSGCYDYTFTFTNTSGVPVAYILNHDPNGSPNVIPLNPPIPDGGTSNPITIRICPPPDGTTCYPIRLILADRFLEECCRLETCVELPDCHCVQFTQVSVTGPSPDLLNYSVTFSFTNLTPDVLEHMFIVPEPPGAFIISPDYFDIPTTNPGQSAGPFKFFAGPLNAGEQYCVRISVHNDNLEECCSMVLCFTAAESGSGPPDCRPDLNADTQLNIFDIAQFIGHYNATDAVADWNADAQINIFDIQSYINAYLAGCP